MFGPGRSPARATRTTWPSTASPTSTNDHQQLVGTPWAPGTSHQPTTNTQLVLRAAPARSNTPVAATRRLHPDTAQQWLSYPNTGAQWHRLVEQLERAQPIPWQHLHHILTVLQQVAQDTGQILPPGERTLPDTLRSAGEQQPLGALIHLPWAVTLFQQPGGYIPATAQEALLQAFLGERQASAAATLAEQWQTPTANTATDRPRAPHLPTPAVPADARPAGPALQHTLPERTPPEGTGAQAANPEPDLSPSQPSSRSDDDARTSSTSSTTSDPEHGGPAVAHPATETTEAANAPRTVAAAEPHNHPTQPMIHGRRLREALARLDPLPATAFLSEPCIMFRKPPPFLRGPLRRALHFALDQINSASADDMRERAWKLWLFLPRLLLHRPAGTQRVPKPELLNRFTQFFTGRWDTLIEHSSAKQRQARRTNQHPTNPNEDARAQRAIHLARLGELSRARQALLAEPLAPGDEATHQRLTDPTARPQQAYQAIDTDLLQWIPATPTAIPAQLFLTNLARAKKGAAPGPSGLTAEIAKLLLDDAAASHSFQQVCHRLATADIPATTAAAIGLGRMVAIRKASGGVRGLVVGDFLRRLVARSLAQHYATDFEAPHLLLVHLHRMQW